MSALTSLLVHDEVVSVQQIEDALQRQVLEGGEIDTALLELGAAAENTLNSYRAASFGLPAASRAQVMNVPARTLAVVSQTLARRHRIVPLAVSGERLMLAAAQPEPERELRELEAALDLTIEWRIATEVRIEAALAQHYGIEIGARMRRLALQVEKRAAGDLCAVEPMSELGHATRAGGELFGVLDDGEETEADQAEHGAETPAAAASFALPPPSLERGGLGDLSRGAAHVPRDEQVGLGRVVHVHEGMLGTGASAGSERAAAGALASTRSSAREVTEQSMPKVSPPSAPASSRSPAGPRLRRRASVPQGPLSAAVTRELLETADDRDAVIEVFFRFARQYFDATALFAIHDERALGLESHNLPSVSDIHEVSVSLEPASTLAELCRSLLPRVVDLSRKATDQGLALALGRAHAQPAALIPVCIRKRAVSLLYGDRDGDPFRETDIAELVALLPSVTRAFERIIRNRKVFALQSRRPPPMAEAEERVHVIVPQAPAEVGRPSSVPAPRASWSNPPPSAATRSHSPPSPNAVMGVFPSSKSPLRPHDRPTPTERPAARKSATLSGFSESRPAPPRAEAQPATGTPEERTAGKSSATPAPPSRGRDAREAKQALSTLGVPRTAPPPPSRTGNPAAEAVDSSVRPTDRHRIEESPTMQLPAQQRGAPKGTPPPHAAAYEESQPLPPAAASLPPARMSKPPPGAGAYRSDASQASARQDDPRAPTSPSFRPPRHAPRTPAPSEPSIDTRPLRPSRLPPPPNVASSALPDTSEPPPGLGGHGAPPPARSEKQPPGTGSYKAHHLDSERITMPPPAAGRSGPSQPPGHSSPPPSTYRSAQAPTDIVSLPPPAKLPQHAEPTASRPRRRSSEITQPLGPRRHSKEPAENDARREQEAQDPAPADVVHMTRALRDSLRPPTSAQAAEEPSIIVDTATQIEQLVRELCRCGPDDETRFVGELLRCGEATLPVLAAHFPGPLWFDRRRMHPRLPLGRDVSAIARALAAFGGRACTYLAQLMAADSADTRFYATLLASDQVQPALLPALGLRIFDPDPQVRLIVKDTLPHYRRAPGFDTVLGMLRARAADANASIQDRLAAIDAIATLRDTQSVGLLIELNTHADKQISVPAHRALLVITGQDFGNVSRKWRVWHEQSAGRHRIEWLIESLMHNDQALRATAGIELQKLTQVYYGFVAAAPKRDRERAQKRYHDWWSTEGKSRFT